jgi:hypothetical protein
MNSLCLHYLKARFASMIHQHYSSRGNEAFKFTLIYDAYILDKSGSSDARNDND